MTFLKAHERQIVQDFLKELPGRVKMVLFTQQLNCPYCMETQRLLQVLRDLSSGNLELEVLNLVNDKAQAKQYHVDKVPAIVLTADGKDYGIRYFGVPSGYEFQSLLKGIREVAHGEPSVSEETKKLVAQIRKPLHI